MPPIDGSKRGDFDALQRYCRSDGTVKCFDGRIRSEMKAEEKGMVKRSTLVDPNRLTDSTILLSSLVYKTNQFLN